MSWKEDLQPASFRNKPFQVDSHEFVSGRRVQTHEFPGKNVSFSEDLGRKKREISFSAYIVDPNYLPIRNELIAACELDGPGDLIHPYFGKLSVLCTEVRISETTTEGGVCRLSLTFAEAGQNLFPSRALDKQAKALGSIAAVENSVGDFFAKKFSTQNRPSFIFNSAAAQLTSVVDAVNAVYKKIPITQELAVDLPLALRSFKDATNTAIGTPGRLFANLQLGFSFLKKLDSNLSLKYIKSLFGTDPTVPTPLTANRIQEAQNTLSLACGTRVFAITSYATALLNYQAVSVQEAVSARQTALDAIDSEMDNLSSGSLIDDDDLYQNLQDLRSSLVLAVPQEGTTLPSITDLTLDYTLPALIVSYRLYNSLDMESDIIARNNIENPGFVMGGVPLEVLTSVRQS